VSPDCENTNSIRHDNVLFLSEDPKAGFLQSSNSIEVIDARNGSAGALARNEREARKEKMKLVLIIQQNCVPAVHCGRGRPRSQ
jgi:hypothetical protein